MANRRAFQDQIRQLGKLISQFDQFPDGPQKNASKELVQLLLDLHGAGLERVMEIVFGSSEAGPVVVDKLARDNMVSSLLVLYSLHPDDLETRVRKSIEQIGPRLRKLGCSAELTEINEAGAQIKITRPDHLCGSSKRDVRATVEEAVYEFAPDVALVEILGLEEPSSTGFVTLDSLVGRSVVASAPDGRCLPAKGMDQGGF